MKLTSFFAVFLLAVSTVLAVTSPAPPVAGSTVGASTLDVAVIEAGNVDANENFDAGKELAVRQIRPPASNHLGGVIDLIVSVVQIIRESIEIREDFTRTYVREARAKWPGFNWVVVCVTHEIGFNGNRGQDWDHWRQKVDLPLVADVTYDIYWFRSGIFIRRGDGGFRNWAYRGNVASANNHPGGTTVVFNTPA